MLTINELIKLLEKAPLWKRHAPLPDKVAELECRVAALETHLADRTSGAYCEHCGSGNVKRIGAVPDPAFGDVFGDKLPKYRCENCEQETVMRDS